jgi:hypothetical protein
MWSIHPRFYTAIAFVAGVLVTLGFKDFYPGLERRFRRRWHQACIRAGTAKGENEVRPTDTTSRGRGRANCRPAYRVIEGVEGCIGNTPLFKIKSLSEETGCDILGKAEVGGSSRKNLGFIWWHIGSCLTHQVVSKRGWKQSKGSCSTEHHQDGRCTGHESLGNPLMCRRPRNKVY